MILFIQSSRKGKTQSVVKKQTNKHNWLPLARNLLERYKREISG